jgi:tetratricopeptide (TPR) repeat protein
MSNNLLREAEFLLRIATENSAKKLRTMLKVANPEREIPILRRLNELCGGQDLQALLRLAFRCWTEGLDDEAISVLKEAQSIEPDDQRVLRLALFFAATFCAVDEAKTAAQRLLDLYPEDQWAATLKDRLESEGALKSVTMPSLGTEWD